MKKNFFAYTMASAEDVLRSLEYRFEELKLEVVTRVEAKFEATIRTLFYA